MTSRSMPRGRGERRRSTLELVDTCIQFHMCPFGWPVFVEGIVVQVYFAGHERGSCHFGGSPILRVRGMSEAQAAHTVRRGCEAPLRACSGHRRTTAWVWEGSLRRTEAVRTQRTWQKARPETKRAMILGRVAPRLTRFLFVMLVRHCFGATLKAPLAFDFRGLGASRFFQPV